MGPRGAAAHARDDGGPRVPKVDEAVRRADQQGPAVREAAPADRGDDAEPRVCRADLQGLCRPRAADGQVEPRLPPASFLRSVRVWCASVRLECGVAWFPTTSIAVPWALFCIAVVCWSLTFSSD